MWGISSSQIKETEIVADALLNCYIISSAFNFVIILILLSASVLIIYNKSTFRVYFVFILGEGMGQSHNALSGGNHCLDFCPCPLKSSTFGK